MSLRDVVEDPLFTQDLDSLRKLYGDLVDDFLAAITWALSNDPRIGDRLDKFPDYRVYTTTAIGKLPSFWVLYTFDVEHVYLHSLQEAR